MTTVKALSITAKLWHSTEPKSAFETCIVHSILQKLWVSPPLNGIKSETLLLFRDFSNREKLFYRIYSSSIPPLWRLSAARDAILRYMPELIELYPESDTWEPRRNIGTKVTSVDDLGFDCVKISLNHMESAQHLLHSISQLRNLGIKPLWLYLFSILVP